MEEKKNNLLLYILLVIIGILIGVGVGYCIYKQNNKLESCAKEECKCEENNNENYIMELFSKSEDVRWFGGNGELKLIKSKNSNFELETKEDLRKFSDEYIIPLLLQHIEFESPAKFRM